LLGTADQHAGGVAAGVLAGAGPADGLRQPPGLVPGRRRVRQRAGHHEPADALDEHHPRGRAHHRQLADLHQHAVPPGAPGPGRGRLPGGGDRADGARHTDRGGVAGPRPDGAGARVPRDDDPDQVRAASRAQPGAVADRAGLRVRDRERVPGRGRLQLARPGPVRGQRHLQLRHAGHRGRHPARGERVRARQPGGGPAAGRHRPEGEGPVSAVPETVRPRRVLPGVGDRFALAGAVLIALIVLAALLAPWLAPYPPDEPDPFNALQPPSGEHWFGTDAAGRDVFTRVLYGGRTSLFIAVAVLAVSATGGVLLGVVAGYTGGWVRDVIMRVTD